MNGVLLWPPRPKISLFLNRCMTLPRGTVRLTLNCIPASFLSLMRAGCLAQCFFATQLLISSSNVFIVPANRFDYFSFVRFGSSDISRLIDELNTYLDSLKTAHTREQLFAKHASICDYERLPASRRSGTRIE